MCQSSGGGIPYFDIQRINSIINASCPTKEQSEHLKAPAFYRNFSPRPYTETMHLNRNSSPR